MLEKAIAWGCVLILLASAQPARHFISAGLGPRPCANDPRDAAQNPGLTMESPAPGALCDDRQEAGPGAVAPCASPAASARRAGAAPPAGPAGLPSFFLGASPLQGGSHKEH